MHDYRKLALELHKKHQGKIGTELRVNLENADDLSVYYTPGVAEPCLKIQENPELAYELTCRGRTVAIVSDGSAVLGLGNIGGLAGMPVMEGKCALFKAFGNIDAVPICLDTQDTEEIIQVVKAIAPSFGGINLEDISAPRCFEIEKRLIEELDIPVFHDDQYGTAIVCLAGMINSLKLVGKSKENVRIVISGAGSAGIAITKLFLEYGFQNISLLDSRGLIYYGRKNLNLAKEEISKLTNPDKLAGELDVAMSGIVDGKQRAQAADIFIGVSQPGVLTAEMVKSMAKDPIIFAMANPTPEIMPDLAQEAGAAVVATGRSDFPNQINNVLVFPGIFKGCFEARARKITMKMKLAAAEALANFVAQPTPDKIIPGPFEKGIAEVIAEAVKGNV